MSYGYYNPYVAQQNQPQYYPQASPQSFVPQLQPQIPTIPGKIVDGIDVVKTMDIPLGSYGIFPKADMSTVYIKTWNNDGTTQIIEYPRLNIIEEKEKVDIASFVGTIQESLDSINKKIDGLKTPPPIRKKREVDDDYE